MLSFFNPAFYVKLFYYHWFLSHNILKQLKINHIRISSKNILMSLISMKYSVIITLRY